MELGVPMKYAGGAGGARCLPPFCPGTRGGIIMARRLPAPPSARCGGERGVCRHAVIGVTRLLSLERRTRVHGWGHTKARGRGRRHVGDMRRPTRTCRRTTAGCLRHRRGSDGPQTGMRLCGTCDGPSAMRARPGAGRARRECDLPGRKARALPVRVRELRRRHCRSGDPGRNIRWVLRHSGRKRYWARESRSPRGRCRAAGRDGRPSR